MMLYFSTINDICKKCGGYKFAPYNSNTSATVKLCHCTEISKVKLKFPKLTEQAQTLIKPKDEM